MDPENVQRSAIALFLQLYVLLKVHWANLIINQLQGDPYGRGTVFVECYFEVAF